MYMCIVILKISTALTSTWFSCGIRPESESESDVSVGSERAELIFFVNSFNQREIESSESLLPPTPSGSTQG